ncbi:gamma-glutamyltransferase [Falsiroseomonas bella]|uniref:Gamma-glutamyltransferase n=1 Tax=Falsiroseomonas bella TaxID=2184016 RepID=A0A317FJ22_9PROT|nr:gamma-glutamyltransferase [Falsiroseomonas bella]PWS38077.1 gamma-glutamyltransferase [Falsiroseomonas bella]
MRTTRPTICGTRHAVSAGHYLASAAAFSVLEGGGNAVDAAAAAGIALGVLHPDIVSVAGVAPILIRLADGRVETIAGLGPWPMSIPRDLFRERHGGKMPPGVLRSVVPAAPDAWITALRRHGTMGFGDVAQYALRFAEDGFAVYDVLANNIAKNEAAYRRWAYNAAIFLPGGAVPQVGRKFVQADLAKSLRHMIEQERAAAQKGREAGLQAAHDAFYRGDIAREITRFQAQEGGFLTMEDMAAYHSPVEPALSVDWRGHRLFTCGPWCQGPTLAQALLLVERAGLDGLAHNSADYIHLITECLKAAFADREYHVGDPRFVDVPMAEMLSPAHIARRVAAIDRQHAHPGMPERLIGAGPAPGMAMSDAPSRETEPPVEAGTSYVCVVDRWGNAVSATPSDGSWTGPLVPGTGLMVSGRGSQNRTDPAHPAGYAPGKRPRLTPMPALMELADGGVMPFGTPGNDVQPQAMLQVLLNLLHFGMSPQEAVEAPRVATYAFPSSSAPHDYFPGRLSLEGRIGAEVKAELAARGHVVADWPEWTAVAGCVELIRSDPESGLLAAAADPRRPAAAIAL